VGESRSRVMVFGHCVVVYGTLEDGVLLAEMGGVRRPGSWRRCDS